MQGKEICCRVLWEDLCEREAQGLKAETLKKKERASASMLTAE